MKVALEKEVQWERMEQFLGQEPMEVGSAHKNQEVADKFLSIMETIWYTNVFEKDLSKKLR